MLFCRTAITANMLFDTSSRFRGGLYNPAVSAFCFFYYSQKRHKQKPDAKGIPPKAQKSLSLRARERLFIPVL